MSRHAGAVHPLLADRYALAERLAVGGTGEVWRARDLLLDRPVAVKTLRAEYVEDEDVRTRLRAEARHTARLSHPGIVSVYDVGELPDLAWLVTELVDGESLASVLRRQPRLGVERTLDVVGQVAAALQVAHDVGVVHRDIKPGNLLLRPDGTVKVGDFGISCVAGVSTITRTGQLLGTVSYLSPEQAAGQTATRSSDLYALGVVAYECLSGVRPFVGESALAVLAGHLHTVPAPLPGHVPARVRSLVEGLLAKDPAQRPASARHVVAEVDALRALPVADRDERLAATPVLAVGPYPAAQSTSAARARPARASGPTSARTQRRAVRATGVLLLLLAVGLGVRGAGGSDSSGRAPGDRTASPAPQLVAPTAPMVRVAAQDVVGLPAAQARDLLIDAGMVPRLVADGAGGRVGTVAAVAPVGDLAVGTGLVLHVVPTPVGDEERELKGERQDDDDKQDRPHEGKANGEGKGKDG